MKIQVCSHVKPPSMFNIVSTNIDWQNGSINTFIPFDVLLLDAVNTIICCERNHLKRKHSNRMRTARFPSSVGRGGLPNPPRCRPPLIQILSHPTLGMDAPDANPPVGRCEHMLTGVKALPCPKTAYRPRKPYLRPSWQWHTTEMLTK